VATLILGSNREKSRTGRILVVEEDWDILEVLKLMLEHEGIRLRPPSTAMHF
jgi:hypothetical protein